MLKYFKYLFFLSCLITVNLLCLAEAVNDGENLDKEIRINDIIYRFTMNSDYGSRPLPLYKYAKSSGFSDEEIRQALINKISQKNLEAGKKNEIMAMRCAVCALDLFRGDVLVEKAVLEACDPLLYGKEDDFLRPHEFWQDVMIDYASIELIKEYRDKFEYKYGKGVINWNSFDTELSRRPQHSRNSNSLALPTVEKSHSQPSIDNRTNSSMRGEQTHLSNEITLRENNNNYFIYALICGLFIAIVLSIVWKKYRLAIVILIGLVVVYFCFKKYVTKTESNSMSVPTYKFSEVRDKDQLFASTHTPDAWRPKPYNPPPPPVREITEYDNLRELIRALSSPFSIADPVDLATNQKEREAAALKLLTLLDAGKPEGVSEEQWLSIFPQVVRCMSCSTHCMDQAMKTINMWIGNGKHSDNETEKALSYMLEWEGKVYFDPDSKNLNRYREIIAMQEKLYQNAPMPVKLTLLSSMASVTKIIKREKSNMPELIVDDQKILDLMQAFHGNAKGDFQAEINLCVAIGRRLVKSPGSYQTFDGLIQKLAQKPNNDKNIKLEAIKLAARSSKTTQRLPEWLSDAEIVGHLTKCYQESFRADKRAPGIEKPDHFAMATWEVASWRATADPEAAALHYRDLMMQVADNTEIDYTPRLEILKVATKIGIMSPSEVNEKYGNDARIGNYVRKLFK